MNNFIKSYKINSLKTTNITFLQALNIAMSLAATLHIIFIVLFIIKDVMFLAIFNVFSFILYLFLILYYSKINLVKTTILIFIEVFLHSTLCIYLVGLKSGFYVYPLCLIPIVYYVSINIVKKELYGHIVVILCILNYKFAKYFLGSLVYPKYMSNILDIQTKLYVFNLFCASSLFIFLTYAFLKEMNDIQENLQSANEMLKNIVNIDPLTNISNRRSIDEKLKETIEEFQRYKKSFSIAICDVDNFKCVNDTYGHDCGDIVLKNISDVLKQSSETFNIEVCRWGGEEFFILLKNYDLESSRNICEKILNDIRELEIFYDDNKIKVTMTFGVAEFSVQNNDLEQVLKIADNNLYKGKKSTKNCIVA